MASEKKVANRGRNLADLELLDATPAHLDEIIDPVYRGDKNTTPTIF